MMWYSDQILEPKIKQLCKNYLRFYGECPLSWCYGECPLSSRRWTLKPNMSFLLKTLCVKLTSHTNAQCTYIMAMQLSDDRRALQHLQQLVLLIEQEQIKLKYLIYFTVFKAIKSFCHGFSVTCLNGFVENVLYSYLLI